MGSGIDPNFWRDRRVLLTGHTGFKGAWLTLWLTALGAKVSGYALAPDTQPSLFEIARLDKDHPNTFGDLRDERRLGEAVSAADPDVVIHMAAQPLVRRSIREPLATFDVNVMGTARLLEAVRSCAHVRSVLVVTTDKVYENPETGTAFREVDPLGGHDPYSASKAAAEIVTSSYARTYFSDTRIPVATARGGNVIGGGDFCEDRIVPDVFRAMRAGTPVVLRNPDATRPWQHVLDCLCGYLLYAQTLALKPDIPSAMNFGPLGAAHVPVRTLAEAMQQALGAPTGWIVAPGPQPREMQALSLDCSLAQQVLGFQDRLIGRQAIDATAQWYLAYTRGSDMRHATIAAIEEYMTG